MYHFHTFFLFIFTTSVAEPNHFYWAPAPGKHFNFEIAESMDIMNHKMLHFVSFFNSLPCLIPLFEPGPSEPEPHRVTALTK
jgi:hypothetical protein